MDVYYAYGWTLDRHLWAFFSSLFLPEHFWYFLIIPNSFPSPRKWPLSKQTFVKKKKKKKKKKKGIPVGHMDYHNIIIKQISVGRGEDVYQYKTNYCQDFLTKDIF